MNFQKNFPYFLIICFLINFNLFIQASPVDLFFSQGKSFVSPSNSTTVEVQLKAKIYDDDSTDKKVELPFELTIVLDRSGSMAGDKLQKSKDSIKSIIRAMKPNDKLNVIVYDSEAQIFIQNGGVENKTEMLKQIDAIFEGGSTNLYAGLELGIVLAKKTGLEAIQNKRIFLFSDGQANVGVIDHNAIANLVISSEIPTSSFGVGSDFDKVLMPMIAKKGNGEFFFIDSAESIEKVVGITSKGFMDLIGSEAQIRFYCPPGVELNKVYGKEKANGGFKIGDLRKNDTLNFFLEFTIDPKLFVRDEVECFYTMTYKNVSTNQEEILKGSFLRLQMTNDETKINETDQEVDKIFKIQKIMEKQEEVQKFLEKDQVDNAIFLMDIDLPKMHDLQNEMEDEDNIKLTETARKRIEYITKKTSLNREDKAGNIENSKQAYYLTVSNSERYNDL